MRLRAKKALKNFLDYGLNIFIVSILTGLFAGAVVTLYNAVVHLGEGYSAEVYSLVRENPAFVPLLFIGLAAGALVIGTFVKMQPMIRGSGIPQIEGAARGIVPFKWYYTLCSMFAASLACIFLGFSAGAEGPSVEIGGCCGDGAGVFLRRNKMVRRLQIAAGAGAGFAAAFNTPVTGVVFALEESFRSFSPQVFICSAISVATALVTRYAFSYITALNINVGFMFGGYSYGGGFSFALCGYAAAAALITAFVGVGFYRLVFLAKSLFSKIKLLGGTFKYVIAFVLVGAFGLITPYVMGGGSGFISALATGGTGEVRLDRVFGAGIVVTLAVVTLLKLISSVLAMGCGVPCGVFVPMLAVGAGLGGLLAVAFSSAGMDPVFVDYIILVCMSAFFTSVVKAPITGLVMVFELTGNFSNLLPALIGVTVGYLISELFSLKPIYEQCLGMYISEEKLYERVQKRAFSLTVRPSSRADGAAVRSVIWPANGLVVSLTCADGSAIVPDGETVMRAGDVIVFECETDDEEELLRYLTEICGAQ